METDIAQVNFFEKENNELKTNAPGDQWGNCLNGQSEGQSNLCCSTNIFEIWIQKSSSFLISGTDYQYFEI